MNNPQKSFSLKSFTTLGLLILGFAAGFYAADSKTQPAVAVAERPVEFSTVDLGLFWTIWGYLGENYVDNSLLDIETMTYGAIRGLVEAIDDPYTAFLDPEQSEAFYGDLNAELQGIGAELTEEEGILTIVSPLKDSPAERAGVRPGDIIFKIEDEVASDFNVFEAVQRIRGEKGTPVTITLIREGEPQPFEVTIIRDTIELSSVTFEALESGLFLISINQFSDDTRAEFLDAVRAARLADAKGVILDLRFNGGGYLPVSIDILSELLPRNVLAVTVDSRNPKFDQELYTTGESRLATIPLVVLINEGSASASEIVAGALQDYERAYLIGQQSFGKGTVQEVTDFQDGSSLRYSIAKWNTPEGRNIDRIGIEPDEVVAITEEDILAERDTQLERAKAYLLE